MRPRSGLHRRGFLQTMACASGGLAIAMWLPRARAADPARPRAPGLYIRIDPDNRVTLMSPKTEMGQGVRTSLAMLIAEELEADWSQVRVETPAYDPALLDQGTGGSTSVWMAFEPLRQVGAAMRMMLIAAAAARWKLPVGKLRAENGYVIEIGSARRASFGELAGDAARLPVPARPQLKPRSQWKLLGKSQASKDVADIVHGRVRYGIDQRPPGMLFASIERPREFGATLDSFDAAAALAVPGVKRVFAIEPSAPSTEIALAMGQITGGVAVVASNTWAALEGRRRLTVRWKAGPHAGESTVAYARDMASALDRPGAELVHRTGDPESLLAKATSVLRADYEVPFLAHATLEPMNCTAHWDGARMTLWSPTQDPDTARLAVATRLGLRLDQVVVQIPLLGGGFGRRLNADFSVEAALVARQLTAPVQVMWTREDDLGHDFYRPCARHRLEACLDERGFPRAVRHRLCDPAIHATYEGAAAKQLGRGESNGIANAFYRVPHRVSEYSLLACGVPRGWWRAVHTTHTAFALESFVDELAVTARVDPLAYRMALIDAPPVLSPPSGPAAVFAPQRMKDCLALAADRAGWTTPAPAGRARGIACSGFDHMSYAAMVVEASLAGRRVIVHRVVCAFDCGTVINPDGARAQVEGAIIQGLSAALHERITIERGRVVETNFHRYTLLRIDQAPAAIEVHFIARPEVAVTGLGEPALPPVAPALGNALFRLTGQRLRTLPFKLTA